MVRSTLSPEITGFCTHYTAPLAIIGFVDTFLNAYREKHLSAC
ncbi:hypothetical protein [Methylobacterium sp. WL7]|nr:hypothetical protein [Methylobacterium sp. WL7]